MNKSKHFSRRNFLQTSTLTILGTGLLSTPQFIFGSENKFSPAVACRDYHLAHVSPNIWDAMKQIGATGVEVQVRMDMTCPYLYGGKEFSLNSPASLDTLRKDLDKNNFHISALMMANRFDERPEQEVEWVTKVVNVCKALDIKAVRLDVVPRKIKRENFLPFAISIGKKLIGIVENTDVGLGIENHGNTTNDPEFLEPLFEGVGSKKLGLTLDTANFYWYGHPLNKLYDIFKKYADRVYHTHCKSINYPEDKENIQRQMGWEYGRYNCPVYKGDIDFAKVVSILKSANYQGDLCIENESLAKFPPPQRPDVLKKEVAYLKGLI